MAELTLAQSSKLAALGEMSAAVSHELNQPLAAMKTYLAGARLLLQRKRPEESLASFQRIDDLIERMGAITRQLKSYARKGGDAFEPLDLRVRRNRRGYLAFLLLYQVLCSTASLVGYTQFLAGTRRRWK